MDVTEKILGTCFEVMNELGGGFLESIYRNALYCALSELGMKMEMEKRFEVIFRGKKIGFYFADLIVEDSVVIELKCCERLHNEHSAQVINYLKVSGLPLGLLINFGKPKIEYKRLHHPSLFFLSSPSCFSSS